MMPSGKQVTDMTTAVLVFHPHMDSSRINARLMREAMGHESEGIKVRDEYKVCNGGPIDVAEEQRYVASCDRIVWQFPMYWYSCPPLLKEWEDEVLTYGWAYGSHGDALRGKDLMLAVSVGSAADNYRHDGPFGYTVDDLLAPFRATANLIGTVYLEPFILTGVTSGLGDEDLTRAAEQYLLRLSEG